MMGPIQMFAHRLWRGDAGFLGVVVSVMLLPLEWVWRYHVKSRNRRFDNTNPVHIDGLRVISIGNLAVGGTGKTPIASWVARDLAEAGKKPCLVHGGYGMDEPALHRRWTPDIPVFVQRDRVAGAHEARLAGARSIVLDDAFQHRWIDRDVDLVILAAEDRFPGPVLPRGPYREPYGALGRADAIVISRRTTTAKHARSLAQRVFDLVPETPVIGCVHLVSGAWRPLAMPSGEPVDARALDSALVLTAVGRPSAVAQSVAEVVDGEVVLRGYADHHEFSESEVLDARRRAGDGAIVVTETDAVKLEPFAEERGACYVMEQGLHWDWGEDAVRALIRGGSPVQCG